MAVPTETNPATAEVIVEVDEDVQWYQYGVTSTEAGVDYNLANVIAEYVPVGMKDLK